MYRTSSKHVDALIWIGFLSKTKLLLADLSFQARCSHLAFLNPSSHFLVAEEMDWDKNGMVNFKEFLFAFTRWVGIDDIEDEEEENV